MNELEFCLKYVKWNRYILIGYRDCLEELLECKARDIKELTWILSEAVYTEKVRDMLAWGLEDYGLAIQVQEVKLPQGYLNADLSGHYPVNILDFTSQAKIPTAGIASGSVWLDMASMEEKRRRIEVRNLDICYYALQEEVEESPENLDTISKNGYNTRVN